MQGVVSDFDISSHSHFSELVFFCKVVVDPAVLGGAMAERGRRNLMDASAKASGEYHGCTWSRWWEQTLRKMPGGIWPPFIFFMVPYSNTVGRFTKAEVWTNGTPVYDAQKYEFSGTWVNTIVWPMCLFPRHSLLSTVSAIVEATGDRCKDLSFVYDSCRWYPNGRLCSFDHLTQWLAADSWFDLDLQSWGLGTYWVGPERARR